MCIIILVQSGFMNKLLTGRAKDKDFPGILQAIVLAVQNRWYGCEEPGQVFEDLRWRCHECHDDKTSNPPGRLGVRASPFSQTSDRGPAAVVSLINTYPLTPLSTP